MYEKWKNDGEKYGGDPDIVLPNGYLSNSSMDKLKSPDAWIEHYLKGNKQDLSGISYIKAGANFADKRENDEYYGEKYPSLPLKEKTIVIPVQLTGIDKKACVLIKVDCASEDLSILQDDKTADLYKKSPWDRRQVYNSQQFRLYSLGVYELTGKIPQFRCCVVDMVNNVETGTFTLYSVQYTEADMEQIRESFTRSVIQASQLVELYGRTT